MTEENKPGLWQRFKSGLAKTRKEFLGKIDHLLLGRVVDDDLMEELEALLITSDFGVETTRRILEDARKRLHKKNRDDVAALREAIQEAIRARMENHALPITLCETRPHVILVVGVNGVGKTTTIGKLAAHFRNEGHRVVLAAGDTFRAAAVEQLKAWGQRAGCQVIAQAQGSDSASVIFDAYNSARAQNADILIADTAGRLHTKVNLMEELKKIKRVLARQAPEAPHDVLLVLDATTGQNAISQARQFHEAMGVTGLVVTKLDGTAKGGVVVGISEQFDLPVRFIGVGEALEDLKPFDADAFVDALFTRE